MNLFENILAKAKTNFANPDPTQNLQFKALQGAANLYTGVAEEAAMGGQREFERRKEVARQFLSQKGYTPDVIDNTLSQIEYKPSFMGRVREGLGNRMLETAKTTDTLSNVQNPLQRLGVGTLAYGGDVVATAMEPVASAISPIVQTGIEKAGLTPTVQNLGQQFQGFKERNPLTGEAIEGVANVSQLAPVPLGKPLAKVAKQGGKAIVKTAEAVAPRVVQGAKFATDIATAPVKSIVNTARKYVATPEEISGIQSAIKPKQRVKNGVVQRSQDAINNEITLTNSLIRQSGAKPTDLATYKTAIKSEMEKIGSEINRLTGQDLTIDITPSTAKLRQLANSDIVRTLDPADTNALLGLADRLDANGGRMSLSMAEEMNQWLNSVLKDTTVPKSEAYKRGLMTLVEDIRNGLDDSISTIPGQFKEIKKAYGALRNVYGDTVAREIVFNRQNMGGLVDSIGAIEGAGSIVSGGGKMLMGDLKGGVADIGRGIASNAVGRFIKSKNDPNNIIRAIFEKGGNKSTLPNIPNKPTNGNIPRNSTSTSPVLDMGTTKKVEGKVIKPAKAKPIVKPSPQVKPVEKTVKPLTEGKQSIGDMETKKLIEEARKPQIIELKTRKDFLNAVDNNDIASLKASYEKDPIKFSTSVEGLYGKEKYDRLVAEITKSGKTEFSGYIGSAYRNDFATIYGYGNNHKVSLLEKLDNSKIEELIKETERNIVKQEKSALKASETQRTSGAVRVIGKNPGRAASNSARVQNSFEMLDSLKEDLKLYRDFLKFRKNIKQ